MRFEGNFTTSNQSLIHEAVIVRVVSPTQRFLKFEVKLDEILKYSHTLSTDFIGDDVCFSSERKAEGNKSGQIEQHESRIIGIFE